MMVYEDLAEMAEPAYREFSSKLIPSIPHECVLGVRLPVLRKYVKENRGKLLSSGFMEHLPHFYLEENLVHAFLTETIPDYDECIHALDAFLPYVDNWSVCDSMRPKVLGKHKEELILKIKEWISRGKPYTIRFGVENLMLYYLDQDFKKEYLRLVSEIKSDDYYVNMMVSWFFATALAKRWKETIPYIEKHKLSPWIHKKTIEKARESLRITEEEKKYLKSLT